MDNKYRILKCCISYRNHYIDKNAVMLVCGGYSCNQCVKKLNLRKSDRLCNLCGLKHSLEDVKEKGQIESKVVLLKRDLLLDLVETLDSEIANKREKLSKENLTKMIEEKFECLENDIDFQIEIRKESINIELENLVLNFEEKLRKIQRNKLKYLNKQLQEIKILRNGVDLSLFNDFKIMFGFKINNEMIEKNIIGTFKKTFKIIRRIDIVENCKAFVYIKSQNMIISIHDQKEILVFNLDSGKISRHSCIAQSISFDSKTQRLFTAKGDELLNIMIISVFNTDFKLIKTFNLDASNLNHGFKILVDDKYLYLINFFKEIRVYNCETGDFIKNININGSISVCYDQNYMYALCSGRYNVDYSIFKIEKEKFEIIKKINIDESIKQLSWLSIDDKGRFIVTGYGKIATEQSQNLCLFYINQNGSILEIFKIKNEYKNFFKYSINNNEVACICKNSIFLAKITEI